MKKIAIITVACMLLSPLARAGTLTVPNTFTAGTPAVAADVNANFTAAKTAVDDNDARVTALEGTALRSPLGILGYAYVACQTGVCVTPPAAIYSYNPSGLVSVTRGGAGMYTVRFTGVAGAGALGGNAQVTAYNTLSVHCNMNRYTLQNGEFVVDVQCYTTNTGTLTDTDFSVLVIG